MEECKGAALGSLTLAIELQVLLQSKRRAPAQAPMLAIECGLLAKVKSPTRRPMAASCTLPNTVASGGLQHPRLLRFTNSYSLHYYSVLPSLHMPTLAYTCRFGSLVGSLPISHARIPVEYRFPSTDIPSPVLHLCDFSLRSLRRPQIRSQRTRR